jgi:hypothetical protein
VKLALVTSGLLLLALVAAAEEVFVDRGACPGEGCRYGERWVASTPVPLRARPDSAAPSVTTVQAGDSVHTLTGEVHTVPGRFVILRAHADFAPGDEILLYTYLGEGWFRIRHDGRLREADLGFSPWGGSPGKRCEKDPGCWGILESELRFDWWVKLRTSEGVEGWTLATGSFDRGSDH